jgi:hypothetical protein
MRSLSLLAVVGILVVSCAKDPVTTGGSGGAPGTGGKTSTGGTTSSGGVKGSGGVTGTGGKTGTGGTVGTGGSSLPPGSVDCTDVSSTSFTVSGAYGGDYINVNGSSGKSYFMQSNWWGQPFNNQSETVSGLGFTMSNPNNVVTSDASQPLGFPSIFIGAYAGKKTAASNLPKQVSALTSVPTIFSTNADQKGTSNYNAAYDVWFTATNALLVSGNNSPGAGGAYLMVWLFSPSDKRPLSTNGTPMLTGTVVKGIPGGWDVWYDDGVKDNRQPCVSYVSSSTLASLEFDLNNFIKDAVTNGYGVTSSQYLSVVFAGFEVWGGGDGLQVKNFCANVK